MCCTVIFYLAVFFVFIWHSIFMPPTQNSIFGELLCRRYKLRCHILFFAFISCYVLTVIPPVKQSSVEVLCCALLFCRFMSYSFMLYFLLSVPQHSSLCISEIFCPVICCSALFFHILLLMQTDKCCGFLRS